VEDAEIDPFKRIPGAVVPREVEVHEGITDLAMSQYLTNGSGGAVYGMGVLGIPFSSHHESVYNSERLGGGGGGSLRLTSKEFVVVRSWSGAVKAYVHESDDVPL
jgi:hypothetical protein